MDKRKSRWVKLYEDGEPVVKQHQIGVVCSKCMTLLKGKFSGPDICPNCKAEMENPS